MTGDRKSYTRLELHRDTDSASFDGFLDSHEARLCKPARYRDWPDSTPLTPAEREELNELAQLLRLGEWRLGEWRPRKRLFDNEAMLLARALDELARLQVEVEQWRSWKPYAHRTDLPEHEREISAESLRMLHDGAAAVRAGDVVGVTNEEEKTWAECDSGRIEVSPEAFEKICEMIERPPVPSERLRRALNRYIFARAQRLALDSPQNRAVLEELAKR